MSRHFWRSGIPSVLSCVGLVSIVQAEESGLRLPVSLKLMDDGRTLLAALERSGELALVDTDSLKPAFHFVGGRVTDVVPVSDELLVALDAEANRAVLLRRRVSGMERIHEMPIAHDPVRILHDPARDLCWIASLWSRAISVVEIIEEEGLYLKRRIELPFEPREMLLLKEERRLLVADAFGGELAVIDLTDLSLESVRALPAHNIRGLALSADGEKVLLSHQRLNGNARTSFDDVHWGMTLTNAVRSLQMADLLDPERNLVHRSDLWLVGNTGQGAADPDDLVVVGKDRFALALAGTNELAIGEFGNPDPFLVEMGTRPTAMVQDVERHRIYVASSLEDLITVVDPWSRQILATVSLNPGLKLTARDRGERMFYSGGLSHDRWMSCHSCHTDGHTTGLLADTTGDGGFGAAKRIPSLLGLAGTEPFGWLGNKPTLHLQVVESIQGTMRLQEELQSGKVEDLVHYLHSLEAPALPVDPVLHARGAEVFSALRCGRCHEPGPWTSPEVHDVGMRDVLGVDEFNPPSLRGVASRRGLFHDGRAASIREALNVHEHQVKRLLDDGELRALVEFLKQPTAPAAIR